MRRLITSTSIAVLAIMVTFAGVFAGAVHITGSTSYSFGSLIVNGSVVGLQSAGIGSGYIRFIGYGYCYTSGGAYWTPTDPDQMNYDANTSDDYPEISKFFTVTSNKMAFQLEMPNPPQTATDLSQNLRPYGTSCVPGSWVWTGATVQVWQNYGAAPGRLLDQQEFKCAKFRDIFQCK